MLHHVTSHNYIFVWNNNNNNNNDIEVLSSVRIYQTRYSRRRVCTNFQEDRLLQWWTLRPNYLAPYKGFTRCYGAYSSHSQELRGEPLLFRISTLGAFTCVTQHMGPMALRPIRRTKKWLSVLLKDTTGDSNPHYADQKHQSLNSVLLTARPWHFHCWLRVSWIFPNLLEYQCIHVPTKKTNIIEVLTIWWGVT